MIARLYVIASTLPAQVVGRDELAISRAITAALDDAFESLRTEIAAMAASAD
jgi:hypothetical protein